MAAPTDADWHPEADFPNLVIAIADTDHPEVTTWQASYSTDDPPVTWTDNGTDNWPNTLNVGAFGPFRVWVRVHWSNNGDTSDWSNPQFVDLA